MCKGLIISACGKIDPCCMGSDRVFSDIAYYKVLINEKYIFKALLIPLCSYSKVTSIWF